LMTVDDLKSLSKIDASFEALEKELDKGDAIALQTLVKKHTGFDITPAEAKAALDIKAANLGYYTLGNELGKDLADELHISFASVEHTGEPVWLIAQGPSASLVHGLMDNTDVYHLMVDAFQFNQ
jgi:alkaline phosphatase